MFQVKAWVSEQLNVNLLLKQIHLDYLGSRDIKQVPSLPCEILALLLARTWADKPRQQLIHTCAVNLMLVHKQLLLATVYRLLVWHSMTMCVFSIVKLHFCSGFCFRI